VSVRSLLNSAQQAQKSGRYAEAERLYLQLLSDGFQPEGVLNALVNISIQSNSLTRASDYLSQLSARLPNKIAYCEALASLYTRAQNWNAAADCYARFIIHNPDHADAHYNYAFNLKQAGNYQQAIDSYQAALDNHVSQPEEVLTNMAVIYSEHLRLEAKAIESLEQALGQAPSYIPAMFNLATLYEEEGNKDRAAGYYQAILKLDPSDHSALVRLAEAQRVSDIGAPIIAQLQAALKAPSIDNLTRISISFALGKVLDDCGEYRKAFKYYADGNRLDRATTTKYSQTDQEQLVQDNIDFFTAHWFANLEPVSDAKPIFICGMFRSGSTLVEQILASHSSVTAGGERDFFVRLGSETISPYPAAIDGLATNGLQTIANQYLEDLARAFPGAICVTDKRPDNFLYLGLIKALFPNARIIHSKRQALDNCLSVYFLRAGASVSYATDLGDIVHYYKQYQRLMAHWEALFSDDIHQLSYDNLVVDPEPQIRALLGFLELPWEPGCLEFHIIENRVKTASIWQVRQPLYQKSSGRWNNYQSDITALLEAFRD
jgi:tetratricopeptide (TPR) repeat protein